MNARNSACFVVVYFGEWPAWFDYFLESCARNPGFHWMFFTTSAERPKAPENVSFHEIDKVRLEELVSRKLGLPYQFSYGYKLCDLKPAYGDIFSDYLSDFDYWGYTDIDLIWGDLGRFLDESMTGEYDVITASTRLLVGHCTLLRNSDDLRTLYRRAPGYPEKLLTEHYEAFDEEDFDALIRNHSASGHLTLWEKSIQTDDCILWWAGRRRFLLLWNCGRLTDLPGVRPLGYFHFIQSKHKESFRVDEFPKETKRFYINDAGIHPLSQPSDAAKFLLSLMITFVMTLPWYAKSLLKMVFPKAFRSWARVLVSR